MFFATWLEAKETVSFLAKAKKLPNVFEMHGDLEKKERLNVRSMTVSGWCHYLAWVLARYNTLDVTHRKIFS